MALEVTGVKQGIVRGTAANIDIKHPAHPLPGQGLRPGAVSGNDRLQVRPGAGDDKIAQRLRERHHRREGIAGFRAFTSDDDRPGVHRLRGNPGGSGN